MILGVLLEGGAPRIAAHVLAGNVYRTASHDARKEVEHRELLQHALRDVAAQLHDLPIRVRRLRGSRTTLFVVFRGQRIAPSKQQEGGRYMITGGWLLMDL